MQKKIKFIFFVIISLFLSITVFAQETKVIEGIKDKITIQPNANSQSGSLTYKDKIGDTSIYVTPQYDKFGGISSNAGLNYNKKFGDSSLFVTPVYNQFGQLSGTAGGTYYEKFGDSLLVVTPQYSKLTGLSTTGSFAIPLTDNFAAGLLLTAGTDKSEIFINSGFRIDDKQRVIFSLGQLRQNLDYNFLSGTENTQVTQNNVGLSYHYFLDKYWVNTVEANGYFSKTQSQNLTDKNYYTDTYELWSDPRRIAGGTVEGFQGRLIFLPTEKTILKVGVGGERLNYDVQTGKDTSNYVTANTEISQKIKPNLDLRASVDYTAAENRYAIGLTHNLGTDRKLSLDARTIRGSTFDDKQIFLSYTQAFGKRDQADDKKEIKTTSVVDSNQIRADIINNVRPLTSGLQTDQFQNKDNKKDFSSTLLNEVSKRPNYFPAQTIAKVDSSAASTIVTRAGAAVSVNYLIVAGGGGGGYRTGGGGGAGGLLAGTTSLSSGATYTIQVGSGGSKGSPGVSKGQGGNGGDSYISGTGFTTITAIGGGGGGSNETTDGSSRSGGSSGGQSDPRGRLGNPVATAGQGNKGGESQTGWNNSPYGAGGGGGAGAVGCSYNAGGAGEVGCNYNAGGGGNGGVGLANDITGTSVYYAGGGGGGSSDGTGSLGGNGGGGNSTGVSTTANATDFTGGGGGGAKNNGDNAGAGGKGVVILSIPTANYSGNYTGTPTITTSGSNTILKFTGNGTYTQ